MDVHSVLDVQMDCIVSIVCNAGEKKSKEGNGIQLCFMLVFYWVGVNMVRMATCVSVSREFM